MKFLAALLLLATLAACVGPAPEPVDEAAVVEPAICRVGHNGAAVHAERGIGGTGAPATTQFSARTQFSDRGIGGTGIVGVVTGFASVCVDGLEVRFDKNAAVSINGSAATAMQLRVGQLVVIKASGVANASDTVARAQLISVRYEVSGPIEAIDTSSGAMTVAGQRVAVLPTTWVAGRTGVGNWISVSGLRRPDGTIVASRLDRARIGALAVRGQVIRERDTTRIGGLVLHGSPVDTVKVGTFVAIVGRYGNAAAEVTAIEPDLLAEDLGGYFGASVHQVIVQALVRVERGMVWLNNDQKFKAGPAVQGIGSSYRNAIVWLERSADGAFSVTALHYSNYRAQPKQGRSKAGGRGAGGMAAPPDARPGPATDAEPENATDDNNDFDFTSPTASPTDAPATNAAPFPAEPSAVGELIADQRSDLPPGAMSIRKFAVGGALIEHPGGRP
jgi:hypothetical protein